MNVNWGSKAVQVEITEDHQVRVIVGSAEARVILTFDVPGAEELAAEILQAAADAKAARN